MHIYSTWINIIFKLRVKMFSWYSSSFIEIWQTREHGIIHFSAVHSYSRSKHSNTVSCLYLWSIEATEAVYLATFLQKYDFFSFFFGAYWSVEEGLCCRSSFRSFYGCLLFFTMNHFFFFFRDRKPLTFPVRLQVVRIGTSKRWFSAGDFCKLSPRSSEEAADH